MSIPGPRERAGKPPPRLAGEMMRSILSCIGEAIVTTDLADRITYMNLEAQALTGWSSAEATGAALATTVCLFPHRSLAPKTGSAGSATREGAIGAGAEGRGPMSSPILQGFLSAKDGSQCPIEGMASPMRDDAGKRVGTVLVFRDVTESREVEHRVQDHLALARNIIANLREPLLVCRRI
jgi:PAS domain-containing protein